MKIKRVLQGTALTALAAAAWMGAGSADASAATVEGININYYGDSYLTVSNSDANEMIVGIAKVNSKGVKVSSWDVYDDSYADVSLEKVNVTKDAYIAVKTDKMEIPVFIKIVAAAKKNKATLNAGTREVTFESDGTKLAADKFWYYDDTAEKAIIPEEWQYQGTSITLNAYGTSYEGKADWKVEEIKDLTDDSKNGKTAKVVTVGKFPTKSVKLNVPKQANGPSVPVDYAKGTIKIKKGVELRVVGNDISNATSDSAFVDKTLSVSSFFDDKFGNAAEDKGTLEVRVVAKTDGKGKAASKWTRVAIEKPKTINASAATVVTSQAVTSKISGDAVSEGSISMQYTVTKKGANKDKADGGLTIENKSAYNVDIVESATEPVADSKGKITGMKTLKKTNGKTTIKNLSNDKKIWVRVSGEKSSKTWASGWTVLHTVALPK